MADANGVMRGIEWVPKLRNIVVNLNKRKFKSVDEILAMIGDFFLFTSVT